MGQRGICFFYKRLASLLSDKWDQPYSFTTNWLRCILSFSFLRSAIHCIRGARSFKCHLVCKGTNPPIGLICSETCIWFVYLQCLTPWPVYCSSQFTSVAHFVFGFAIDSRKKWIILCVKFRMKIRDSAFYSEATSDGHSFPVIMKTGY